MALHLPDEREVDGSSRSAKRPRTGNHDITDPAGHSYRKRSPLPGGHRDTSKRSAPGRTWRNPGDRYRPLHHDHRQRQRSASPGRDVGEEPNARPKNSKSTRERKENPSTRIRSLRNLLNHGGLPATVHQEKERELAALLFEQQKEVIRQGARKNLQRYHFIRFVERQKATRTLKKLKKQQEAGDTSEGLTKQIHEAEVDLNYTLYTPLAQKYIAIFAREDNTDGKAHPLPRNLSRMSTADYARLSAEQRHQIEVASMEAANTLHLADGKSGVKPPMWYVVEAKMKEGQKALETLKDEKPKVDDSSDLVLGKGAKKTPDWLNDDGMIDAEDLDSDSNEEDGGAAVNARGDNDDDEMSDGDGGFFEKR